jgi:hypothetical protein
MMVYYVNLHKNSIPPYHSTYPNCYFKRNDAISIERMIKEQVKEWRDYNARQT